MINMFFLMMIPLACVAMEDANAKWHAKDLMQRIGLEYSDHLIVDEDVDKSRILSADSSIRFDPRLAEAVKSGYEAPVYIKFINSRVGYGVCAETAINDNDIIAEYTGRLTTGSNRTLSLDQTQYFYSIASIYAGYNYPLPLFIDAKSAGNSTRFINHSYSPNVSEKIFFDGTLWHVIFLAAKRIEKDQQLFINYGKDYWQARGIQPLEL